MNSDNEKFVEILRRFGHDTAIAKIIIHMFKHNTTISVNIEYDMKLRQPEVCVAIQKLRKMGIISKTEIKKNNGKGRPTHLYKLEKTPQEIFNLLKTQAENQLAKIKQDVTDLHHVILLITDNK